VWLSARESAPPRLLNAPTHFQDRCYTHIQNRWIERSLPRSWHINKAFLARQGEDSQEQVTRKRAKYPERVSEGKLIVLAGSFRTEPGSTVLC
jgi:hypothetical protein